MSVAGRLDVHGWMLQLPFLTFYDEASVAGSLSSKEDMEEEENSDEE